MSFGLYFAGFIIVIGGAAWGMVRAGLPTVWIIISCIILFGLGILSGVTRTRSKDLPKAPPA